MTGGPVGHARQYEPRRGKRNGAGAKRRNPGVRRTGRRKAGTILLRAGTECEIIPGENPPSTGTIAPLKVMHASDDKPAP